MKDYKETAKQGIDEISKNGTFASIRNITYNDDFSKIVIHVEKDKFENGLDAMAVMTCGVSSCIYQMFDINAPGNCFIEVKDVNTGETFKTVEYPKEMQTEN